MQNGGAALSPIDGPLRRAVRSLAVANARRYFAGYAVSVVGTWMQRVGQDWLVVRETHSPTALSLTLVLQFAPMLVFGMYGGVIVDRFSRRGLLIASQLVQGGLALALGLIAVADFHPLAAVYVLTLALGVVTVVDQPARQVFVGELVGRDDLVNAITLASTINNVGRLVGPALAGGLIAAYGVPVTFFVNAASFAGALAGLIRVQPLGLMAAGRIPRAPGQVRDGLRYALGEPQVRFTILLVASVSLFGQNFRVVLPILGTSTYGGGASTYAFFTAMLGLGAVVGGLVTAGASRPSRRSLTLSCIAFGAANLVVAAMPTAALAGACITLIGVSNIAFNTIARSLLQYDCAPEMRGRVMALYSIVFLGATPVGAPIAGLLCQVAGARIALVAAGLLSVSPLAVPRLRAR